VEQGRVEKSRHHHHRDLNSLAARACGRSRAFPSPATKLASITRKKMARRAVETVQRASLDKQYAYHCRSAPPGASPTF
jgi:hypothetical protein